MQVGRVSEGFYGEVPVLAQAADGAAEGGVGGRSGGYVGVSLFTERRFLDSHLPDDLAEADSRSRGEQELAGAVDQSDAMEPVDGVECVDSVAAFADDLLYRPGALFILVDEKVEDGPLGLGLLLGGQGRLLVRHGRPPLSCLTAPGGYHPRRGRLGYRYGQKP